MNRLFNTLFFSLLSTISIFGQTVEKNTLINIEGQWNIYQPYPFLPPASSSFLTKRIDATAIYFFDGDTLINEKNYQKIYQTAQSIVDKPNPSNQYVGALREVGQQVYFIREQESAEILLYDYDLTVGDTMWVEKFEIDIVLNVQVILESIDSIQTLDQQIRKRLNFSVFIPGRDTIPQYFTSWIEGIGDIGIGGFLETHLDGLIIYGYFDFFNGEDYTSFLQCFSKENQVVYQSEKFDECYTPPSYTPFPSKNGIWKTLESRSDNYAPNIFGSIQKTRTHFMYGDTTISSQFYYKLYTTQAATIPTQPNADQYVGAFREADKVIYFYEKATETERILYDFNIEIGDTIATLYDDVATEYNIFLGKIDTIQTSDNQFRKRYELRMADNLIHNTLDFAFPIFTYWIEGIGDVGFGLLSFPQLIKKDAFQCFSGGDNLVYQNPMLDNCFTDMASYTIDYTPLVVENATWIMLNVADDVVVSEWAYKIQGDTIVEGMAYKKLYYYECPNDDNMGNPALELAAILRENTSTKKVYGYVFNDHVFNSCSFQEETLLFDFNKEIGADFEDCHVAGIEESTTIVEESLEFVYGAFRRVLTSGADFKLIEGVGYRDGLFIQPTSFIVPGYYTGLTGYKQDEGFGCEIILSTSQPLEQKVNIYPNPTKEFLSLQFEQFFDGQIQLHSLAGQVLYQREIKTNSCEINVSGLPKGIYFLHLQAEEGYLVRKIVVQ